MLRRQTLFLLLIIAAMLFQACENDIEKINMITSNKTHPSIVGENIEVVYSDSAVIQVRMTAPKLFQYNKADRPYSEFPEGVTVDFFGDSMQINSQLTADHAIYYTKDKLWHATGNVVLKNLENNQRLDSEELFWNEEKKEIYSNTVTRVEDEDGVLYGQDGFRSNQSFEDYVLIGSVSGNVNIEENEENE